MEDFDVIVVGAGPAGLLAAGSAAEQGARVLVLEKMRQAGRKLLITGKGRCNITNDADPVEFIQHVYPNGRFLRSALGHFFSQDILKLLHDQGVETTLERGGRYFPASNKSSDVLAALLGWLGERKVDILCGQRVEKLLVEGSSVKVILALGGKSYPATGSNGEGYALAQSAGHSIVPARPSLVPLETAGNVASRLQGLTLKNVRVTVWVNNKKGSGLIVRTFFSPQWSI